MFKKPFTQKTQSKVRSSDRRQLWQQIAAAYGQDWAVAAIPPAEQPPAPTDAPAPSETAPTTSAADDGLASQLSELTTATAPPSSDGQPSQAQLIDVALSRDLEAAKFVTHVDDMGILYFDEHDQPLWFRTQLLPPPTTSSLRPAKAAAGPRTIIAPTVYTLWKFPTLLPKVYTHVPVLEHLVSGADLMLPGVIRPPYAPVDASLQPGQIVTVAVRNAGTEGPDTPVAVGYLALSGSEILQSAPRAKGKAVHILHTYMDYVWQHGDKSDPPLVTMPTGEYEAGVDHQAADDDENGQTTQGAAPAEATSANEAAQPARPDLTTEEIDTWFQRCLLQTLVVDLPADRLAPLLPLSTSTLHSAHMIPNQPADIPLDIKKSSYKKLSKFFKVMDKKGLLKVKELKGGEMLLLSVNRQAKELTTFEPLRKSKLIGAVKHQAQSQGDTAAKGGEGDRAAAGQGMISISDVYRPRTAMVNFLTSIGIAPEPYYSRHALRNIIAKYVVDAKLKDPKAPKYVILDDALAGALLKANENPSVPRFSHEEVGERALAATELCHRVQFPDGSEEYRKGKPAHITIMMEKKMGRKVVTRIVGHERYNIPTNAFQKKLQVACAASVTVHELPAKSKQVATHEIMAQGHQGKTALALLAKEGVPRNLVDITDKTVKK